MDARLPFNMLPARKPLRPLVRLAVRTLGPGPLRLRMVKLAHALTESDRSGLDLRNAA